MTYPLTTQPPTTALPAAWECSHGPADDEPYCAQDEGHVCPTIRVHPDDAKAFAALVEEAHQLRSQLDTARVDTLREAADLAESLRQFERCTGSRRAAQTSENVGILRVADELRRTAAEARTA